ncbi:IS5 family transposase [Sphaerospermopsis torques-reginae]|uniref:IS5 family transposase n=1 Tax=Sphaerospermopsis torques-reginae ITEP-024 TaxID=984208 RepID=A0ABX8X3L8_9CYAN|nr:IS5 family transposase [Sphaerospermopsis torques-reginae]QYX33091.1 IS5 family transposase [Sphaerospermopsis torques-reginae ITEP-024]
MYRKQKQQDTLPEEFELPFGGKLAADNRWVILAKIIPWTEFEAEYAAIFTEVLGAPAKTFRMALGALIIKEKLGTSDRETVEQIRENPYLQYFIGMSAYSNQTPFDPSMLVHFRERIDMNLVNRLNQKIVKKVLENQKESEVKGKKSEVEDSKSEVTNRGKLILDASCAPADISYPTDLGLLNQARKHTEIIIDILYNSVKVKNSNKPRTYRKIARKEYLVVARKKKVQSAERRKAIKKQLQYIKRNLAHIQQIMNGGASLLELSNRQYKMLLVVAEVYRQQLWLYEHEKRSIEDRIVSLSQPHIRPIVRGKAAKNTEFGAKFSASCFDGYVFLDQISWDNFNESVHVDKIYRTRDNRDWCKERGIRISGPPLGRPPKNVSKETKKQAIDDERIRNSIEGKFGQGKRRFSLGRVMTKLPHTSLTSIAISFLVMNLSTLLSRLFWGFFCPFFKITSFLSYLISEIDVFVRFRQQKLIFISA